MKVSIKDILLGSLLLISCGQKNTSEATASEIMETSSASVSSSNGNCLLAYQDKYDQLLPLENIQKHFTTDWKSTKKTYILNKNPKYRNHDTYTYSWPSERTRTMEIAGRKLTVPIDNRVGLTWVGDDLYKMSKKKSDLENFQSFYRTPTKEELERAFEEADKRVGEQKDVSKDQKNAAMGLAKGMAAQAKFEQVSGIGDAAAWKPNDNELVVLVGGLTFQVIADVSSDANSNLELAKKLALEVLKKCN